MRAVAVGALILLVGALVAAAVRISETRSQPAGVATGANTGAGDARITPSPVSQSGARPEAGVTAAPTAAVIETPGQSDAAGRPATPDPPLSGEPTVPPGAAAGSGEPSGRPTPVDDGPGGPSVVVVGEVPPDLLASFRADFDALQAFAAEHFGVGLPDYTVYVAPDWSSAEQPHQRLIGRAPQGNSCVSSWSGGAFVVPPCPGVVLWGPYFEHLLSRLAPGFGGVTGPDGIDIQGPEWLRFGVAAYSRYAYVRSTDAEAAGRVREGFSYAASRTGEPLRAFENVMISSFSGSRAFVARGFFATEWLAERAGAPALLEYYRLVASSPNWQRSFEEAFGLGVDAFYEAVEPYIDEIAPSASASGGGWRWAGSRASGRHFAC